MQNIIDTNKCLNVKKGEELEIVKKLILQRFKNKVPKALVRTYGCQQNFSDSEKIKGVLAELGFFFTGNEADADLILFNTCAIREHAEDRVFGNVGALKNIKMKNPSLIIALCGCMMEQEHIVKKIRTSFPFVDLVFGTHSISKIPELIYKILLKKQRVFENVVDEKVISEDLPVLRENKIKASVPIMYGCDNFCSYCVVPYVRGREKSREPSNILKEVSEIINSGYKEITLLGQNVNSYGKNLTQSINFSELLKRIDSIDGEYWIRFMTSHPKDASCDLIDTMATGKHICKHLHLPFQSGNNNILKKMNRHYTREKYLEIINYAKKKIPDISITSDVIVGFPGETYEEFCDTLSLIKEVGFSSLFTFIYSKREGTIAATLDDPIPYEEKSKWFSELLKVQTEIADNLYKNMIGKKERVLVEDKSSKDGIFIARTSGNIAVEIEDKNNLIGQFVDVLILDAKRSYLTGKIV
ncbi:MAG: tRNA-2-methylthio-N(6)-dimethylallyladenosine synthase [Eubacteriales bacterium SKADARSKE-1]|nr:tRNA-2-methylthio-N(6)-dimethylallyladenosine synthase [Eubacteriales bacterium SKADARSKE-1]